jgi:TRAP-type C4-dicarboxylate transport system permease small subunit
MAEGHGREDQRDLSSSEMAACRLAVGRSRAAERFMPPLLKKTGAFLRRRAENVLAALLAGMFAAFIMQIVFRYLLQLPMGWPNEISVILWLWLVLWGAAFVLREDEEIRFDLFYAAARPRTRRIMFLLAAAALIVLYGLSLPAVWDYVAFMRVERTAYLKIRFDWLFSIYIVFVVAVLVRYLFLSWQALFGRAPEAFDPTKAGSGV